MPISHVGSAQGTTSATLPAFNPGDLAIVSAYRDGSTTAPTLPGTFLDVPPGTAAGTGGANLTSFRVGYRVLQGGDTDTGTWANANSVIVQVYRGHDAGTPIGDVNSAIGLGTAYTYGSLTLQVGDGTSWIAGFSGHRDETASSGVPAEMTARQNDVNATERADGWDTNAGTASGAISDPDTNVASLGRFTCAVEIRAAVGAAGTGKTNSILLEKRRLVA